MATRILVSNDDGIFAPGIQALAASLETLPDVEVWVVAPDREQSAQSHSLTLGRPLRIREVKERQFAVDGTPTDSVYLGINHIMKRDVDLVVSGFNHGANLGEDVIYSGTVAAAREGALLGVPAIAFSLVRLRRGAFDFSAYQSLAPIMASRVLKEAHGRRFLINVNIPNIPAAEIKGVQWTHLGSRTYGADVVEARDPRGQVCYWIGGSKPTYTDSPGSDCNAILDHYASVTALSMDLTDHKALDQLEVSDMGRAFTQEG